MIDDHRATAIVTTTMMAAMMSPGAMAVTMATPIIMIHLHPVAAVSIVPVIARLIVIMVHFPIRGVMAMMMVVIVIPHQRRSHCANGQSGHYRFCSAVTMSVRALIGDRHRHCHHTRQ